MTQQQNYAPPPRSDDPFGDTGGAPSVSFKDAPVGASYTLAVLEAPTFVQSRHFETGEPAFWPDGNPKWSVVTKCCNQKTGEECSLWAAKPSAMFAAIAAAQQQAGAQIAPGGILTITYTGDKPNPNPRLNAAKQYTAAYQPPDAFAQQANANDAWGTAAATPTPAPVQAPPPAQNGWGAPPVQQAPPPPVQQAQQAPPPPAPAQQQPGMPTAEQIAAVRATGMDPAAVWPQLAGTHA